MEMKTNLPRIEYCSECQVGIMRDRVATYYTWIGEEIITVPDFPCTICDVCGRREWDENAIHNLKVILRPNIDGIISGRGRIKPAKEAGKKRPRRVSR